MHDNRAIVRAAECRLESRGRALRASLLTFALLLVMALMPAFAGAQAGLDVDLFSRVPEPGKPEGIAVDSGGLVYAGTSPKEGKPLTPGRPSKLFAFDGAGQLVREYTIEGQDLTDPFYGLYGMAFDGDDQLYIVDAKPARIIALDPATGRQHVYAEFRDVRPCALVTAGTECSETLGDLAAFPNYPVFAPDGTMYVTDVQQALIWRIPPGGGRPEVWLTDSGLESVFGPNGITIRDDGRTLVFVLTFQSNPLASRPRTPGLYEVEIGTDGAPGPLSQLWQSAVDDGSDGVALTESGNAFVAVASANPPGVAVISPQGEEIARVPASLQENSQQEVPFDSPGSIAFLGSRALVTNHAFISGNPQHYAVLSVQASEPGQPLFRPHFDPRGAGRTEPRTCGFDHARIQFGTSGNDALWGGRTRDALLGGRGTDELRGRRSADCLLGQRGRDVARGGGGPDQVRGGHGADRLRGGRGRDTLRGGRGPDVLHGGPGRDTLRCGAGRDKVIADRADRVQGCERVVRGHRT